jgi:hypothetical protein
MRKAKEGDSAKLLASRASSTGRRNALYSVDPTALPEENRFTGLYIN